MWKLDGMTWRGRITFAACALVLAIAVTGQAAAQEHGEEHHAETGEAEQGEHAENGFHRHHLSVFLGVTDGEGESADHHQAASAHGEELNVFDERAGTVGLDYEYRLKQRWGVGALIDYAGGDLETWVFGFPIVLHPAGQWKFLVAPGVEDKPGHDAEFLVRAGVIYDFQIGRMTIAPAVNVDFVDGEEVLVYGVNIGKGF